MEMRTGGRALSVPVRTPGHDFDLAAGFLASEGAVHRAEESAAIRSCAGTASDGTNAYNIVDVTLAPGVAPSDVARERKFLHCLLLRPVRQGGIDAVDTSAGWAMAEDELRLSPES
ncbi:hypothetical protein ACFW2K_38195 [Streptomyces nigra]|uniref:hypothetical protein n=1 Tax=Streptomyces nigra TaxID=1827580 RepID=UPI0036A4E78E